MAVHSTFCRICESLCGLEVEVEGGRIQGIRPDPDHIVTKGFACPKGLHQHRIYDSPDRLEHPLVRRQGGLQTATWEEALSSIGGAARRILERDGPDAIAMYVGTAAGFSVLHPVFAQGFMTGLGSRSMYASATQDCSNKFAVANEVYGFPFTQPFPDVDETRCLVIVGANPVVSKWSFLQVANPADRIKQIQARGGRVVVVDPRRTETAKLASEHLFIRPGTDVFFYLAFLHEVVRLGAIDLDRVERYMRDAEAVEALVAPWTPERCAEATGVAPADLRRLVAAYLDADGAALYCSTGVNMGGHGALAYWLQEVINAVTGNLDRRGGTLVGRGIIDFPAFGKKNGVLTRTDRSRVGGFVSVNDAFPGGVLADEILTEGPGQVKALFVTGGNPLITMANAGRLKEAFASLELLVVLDILPNETASVATHVLPCTAPFQRPDLPFIFPLMLGLQTTPYLQATRAVEAPRGAQRDEASIYLDLCRACGVDLFGSSVAQTALETAARFHQAKAGLPYPTIPQEALLSTILRVSGQKSFGRLLKAPHGDPRPPHRGGDFLGARVTTEDGRVHLAPPRLLEEAEGLDAAFQQAIRRDRLRLITKRHVKTHNSWTHNLDRFVAGAGADTNHLYMHPDDAAQAGLQDGALVDVASDAGTVRLPLRLLTDLMPGSVALPHGWGHQGAAGLSVASRTAGVNVNLLAADGPERLERISGMARLTGIPVTVRPAAGPRAADWSGIDPAEARR